MTETGNGYERFVRWQGITREQLGATSNLVLGLATGLLAFTATLLLEKKFLVSCAVGFSITAIILLGLSVILALWCAINRLTDFRLTAKIANPKNSDDSHLDEWREESRRLGEKTWNIFRSELLSFALGSGSAVIGIFIQLYTDMPLRE